MLCDAAGESHPRGRRLRQHRLRLRLQARGSHEESLAHAHHRHLRPDALPPRPGQDLHSPQVLLHRQSLQKRSHGRHAPMRVPSGQVHRGDAIPALYTKHTHILIIHTYIRTNLYKHTLQLKHRHPCIHTYLHTYT